MNQIGAQSLLCALQKRGFSWTMRSRDTHLRSEENGWRVCSRYG
jgi:hypothetical protein